ncbi:MAG: N-acetylglucosamine-6-phosphate deacetylase [Bacilli bacterium]|nr:N-acetylglucosamine-6-phosphate deacetylase [Bacilli bacterium]
MEIKGFKNSNIVLTDKVIKGSVASVDGKFAMKEVEGAVELPENLYIVPGFIDEHIHGCNGKDTMDATREALETMAKALPQEGVTSFCPTTMTMGVDTVIKALENVRAFIESDYEGATAIGVHLEGPFINKTYKGAQPEQFIIPLDPKVMQKFVEASGDTILIATIAYENDGEALLKYLVDNGITASIGHSDCSAAKLKEGFEKGISSVTHMFNAQSKFNHREPGIVGEALLLDGLKTELIADTIHVCPDAIKLLFKCKKKEDIVLITDSLEGKFLAPGQYQLAGQKIFISATDPVARLENGTIAGSILSLNKALRNIHQIVPEYTLPELINLCTINPAKNLHMDGLIGSIEEGKVADFVIIDKDFNVYATYVAGKEAYRKEGFTF